MSLVDSSWNAAYERVTAVAKPSARLKRIPYAGPQHEGKCTSFAAALASVSRLKMAICSGGRSTAPWF
jgi:hypothetical protein